MSLLINAKANIHAKDAMGDTPLHVATFQNSTTNISLTDTVKRLLEGRADPNAENTMGLFSLWQGSVGQCEDVRLMLEYGGKINKQVPANMANRGAKIGVALISRLAYVDPLARLLTTKIAGSTTLHMAAAQGNGQMVKFLLQKRSDPNLKASGGFTVLQFAQQEGFGLEDKKIIQMLRDAENGIYPPEDPPASSTPSSSVPLADAAKKKVEIPDAGFLLDGFGWEELLSTPVYTACV